MIGVYALLYFIASSWLSFWLCQFWLNLGDREGGKRITHKEARSLYPITVALWPVAVVVLLLTGAWKLFEAISRSTYSIWASVHNRD